jgi:hypothetical protein
MWKRIEMQTMLSPDGSDLSVCWIHPLTAMEKDDESGPHFVRPQAALAQPARLHRAAAWCLCDACRRDA